MLGAVEQGPEAARVHRLRSLAHALARCHVAVRVVPSDSVTAMRSGSSGAPFSKATSYTTPSSWWRSPWKLKTSSTTPSRSTTLTS